MRHLYRAGVDRLDRFLFESCEPRVCSLMRIVYGTLLLVFVAVWILDASRWFTDQGILRSQTAQEITRGQHWSLLFWLPSTPGVVYTCLGILWLQSLLLMLGCASRVQAACIFVWLTSFQHRNPLITDGEDTVFRLLIFFMMFMPLDHAWSLGRWLRGLPSAAGRPSAWALRLVQLEMTAVYASTAWSKWQGATWRDGTALYYVSRMEDVFGRLAVPDGLFETEWMLKSATWGVLAVETLLPVLLWIPRTRRLAIVLGIGLHLSIEVAMHLFLFEWIMIVGLLSFLAPRPSRARGEAPVHSGHVKPRSAP